MLKKIIILANFFVISCAGVAHESPVIYFSNASSEPIKNIRCEWASNVLTLPSLNPGDSRSQSFYINKVSHFFGLVKVSWVSEKGDEVKKEFFFHEKNLPSLADPTTYNYVQLYFDQSDLEIVSSDAPDLGGKTRRMDQLLSEYRNQYSQGHPKSVQTSLIRVQPIKDRTVPAWLSNSY